MVIGVLAVMEPNRKAKKREEKSQEVASWDNSHASCCNIFSYGLLKWLNYDGAFLH